MRLDFHAFHYYIEKHIPSKQLHEFLCKTFNVEFAIFSQIKDFTEFFIDITHFQEGFRTEFHLYYLQPDEVPDGQPKSFDELAVILAKEFQTRVMIDFTEDHPLAEDPYYWQMYDAEGRRYIMAEDLSNNGKDDPGTLDEEGNEVYCFGPEIAVCEIWPGKSLMEELTSDDDD